MEFVNILSFIFLLFIGYTLVNGSTPKVSAILKVDIAQVLFLTKLSPSFKQSYGCLMHVVYVSCMHI